MQKSILVGVAAEEVDVIHLLHRTTHLIPVRALVPATTAVPPIHAGVVAGVNLIIMSILCYIYYYMCV